MYPDLNLSVSERSMFNASGRPRTGRLAHTGSGRFIMGVNGYCVISDDFVLYINT